MKYIAGGLGSDFRGKLGSVVGSRNYSANFLRKLNVPRDPKTALQLSKRSNFYTIAKAWQLVTAPNLILWKNLAYAIPFTNSLRQTYYLTAFQMFSFCNLNMMQNGYSLNLVPGPIINNNFPSLTGADVKIVTTLGAIDIKLILPAIPTVDNSIIVMATGIISSGISKPKGFRYIFTADHTFMNGGSIMSNYLKVFPIMPLTDQIVAFKLYYIDNVYGFKGLEFVQLSQGNT